MIRRFLLAFQLLNVTLFAFFGGAAQAQPNIVIIVSDDQGYADLGCFGSKEVKTPNLDQLAAGGIRLTNFYVTWPACTPSRGSLLTGRYPQRNGIYDMIRNEAPDYGKKYSPAEYRATFERIGGMDTREILLPRLLKQAGYRSGIFGKWDLGMQKRFLPLARGFDQFYGFVNTGIDYFTHERYGVPSMFHQNHPTVEDQGTYCTHLFEREALRFLEGVGKEPFFLYLPFNAPHGASSLAPAIRGAAQAPEKYKKLYPHLPDTLIQGKRYGKDAMVPSRTKRRLEYLASITCMDEAIGRVLERIDKMGKASNTIVIFFSDNGGGGGADNGPLRGKKGDTFEGGIRVPCIVRFPGKVTKGTTSDEFVTALEILPTLLQQAGVKSPPGLKLDGFDMLPVLQGGQSQRREMFWQRKDRIGVRVGKWKWVEKGNGKQGGLFDLSTDPGERHDLSTKMPDVARRMKAAFARWRKEMDSVEPREPFMDF